MNSPINLDRGQRATAGVAAAASLTAITASAMFPFPDGDSTEEQSMRFCLNTSTIRGQTCDVEQQIDKLDGLHGVYPGNGVAPLPQILSDRIKNGFHGSLSLDLFNPDDWNQPVLDVARTGLRWLKVVALLQTLPNR